MIDHLTYLFTIFFFVGLAMLSLWSKQKRLLKRYELVILIVAALSLFYPILDHFALSWGAWIYYPKHTLNIKFITEIETFLFSVSVSAVVASATVILAYYQDRSERKTRKRRSSKRQILAWAVGSTKR